MKERPYIVIYKSLVYRHKTVSHIVYAYNLREAKHYGVKLLGDRKGWVIERVLQDNG